MKFLALKTKQTQTEWDHEGRPGSQKIGGSPKTGFPGRKIIGQMCNRYNGDQNQ